MNEKVRNKDWIKNAAIVFLVIMLFLTFFSNTIMNRTLPEVATSEATSGTITAQVRGTGKVTADGSYQVKAPSSREIRAVMVKVGQTVEAGDVLFVLGSGDSEELEAAEEKLLTLQTSYAKAAVGSAGADTAYLKAELKQAKADLAEAEAKMEATKPDDETTKQYEELVEATKANLKGANDALTAEYAIRDEIATVVANDQNDVTIAQEALDQAQAYYDSLPETATEEEREAAQRAVDDAKLVLEAANTALSSAKAELETEEQKVSDAEELVATYQAEYDRALALATNNSADYQAAKTARDSAQETIDSLKAQISSAEQSAGVSEAQNAIELESLAQQIEKQQQVIEELSGGGDNQILAEVAGTVQSISITAGTSAKKGDVIAEIEVPDSGYSLSFTVTNEQAKMLHVGDTASAVNIYWGSTIDATLTSITRDPKNPTTNMVLTFDVSGDVASGKEVTLTVGSRSASYDLVVPNNAIKSDTNGDFVLAIQEKSSPLGNRYIAKRVSVEKLASDDKNTAITGELESGTFVITTSNKPVSNGKQVKLAD